MDSTPSPAELIRSIDDLVVNVQARYRTGNGNNVILHPDDRAQVTAYETSTRLHPGTIDRRYGGITYSIKAAPGRPVVFVPGRDQHFTQGDFR